MNTPHSSFFNPAAYPDNKRRLKLYKLSPQALQGLLSLDGKTLFKLKGFPSDGVIENVWMDPYRNTIILCVSSSTFPPIEEGSYIGDASSIEIQAQSVGFPDD